MTAQGAAIARRLVEEGAKVIAADLSSHETALGRGNPAPLRMDVQDPASVEVTAAGLTAIAQEDTAAQWNERFRSEEL